MEDTISTHEVSFHFPEKKREGGVKLAEIKRGRPKKPKIKIAQLIKYLDELPEDSPIKRKVTYDQMMIVKRLVEELFYMESLIHSLKMDIHENNPVEDFVQGKQRMRRTNPAIPLYYEAVRSYKGYLREINSILHGVDVW